MLYSNHMKNYRIIRDRLLKNPNIKREYELLRVEYETIGKIIELRIKNKLTQKQLAEKIGTKQSAVSRFEKKMVNPTLYTLSQIAEVFGKKLVVEFK